MKCLKAIFPFLFLGPFLANTQVPSYIHYEIRDGLPSNLVYCCYQDRQGLMWFGTNKGLASFDGVRFHSFGSEEGLMEPEILGLFEDSRRRLWISNFGKAPAYREAGCFNDADNNGILRSISVQNPCNFYEDKEGNIYIPNYTPNPYVLKEGKISKKRYIEVLTRGDAVKHYINIEKDMFALCNRLILQCDQNGNDKVVQSIHIPPPNPYLNAAVSGNRLLCAYSNGLLLFEWKNNKMRKVTEMFDGPKGLVFSDSKGRFWVCSEKDGAICFNNMNRDLSHPTTFLPGKKILSMMEDKQNTIWFCTAGEGVFALPKVYPSIYGTWDNLQSDNITALCFDHKNRLWAGDYEGNIHLFSENKWNCTWSSGAQDGSNRCRQLVISPDNKCWMVTDDFLMWGDGNSIHKTVFHAAYKSAVTTDSSIWYISYSHIGIIYYEDPHYSYKYQVKKFTTLGKDFSGNIWAGRLDGLYCTRDNMSKNWADLFPQLGSRVIAISPADSNHLWVVTASTGLLYVGIYDGSVTSVSAINTRLEEPIQNIQSISTTSSGQLWMATNNGVYGLEKDWTLHHYDYHDGLPANDVNAVVAQEDTLWVGTVAGLGRFVLPSGQKTGNFASLITALRYRKSNSLILYNLLDSTISPRFTQLPPNARVIEFDLGALDFCSRRNLKFECLLEENLTAWYYWTPENLLNWVSQGFRSRTDTSWSSNGTLNLGVQLSPGLYNIRITALSTTGQYSNQPSNWTVLMTPQWYQTVWVFLALWAFLAWGIWMYFRIRSMNREFGMKVAQLQLQTLQSQISPHFIGNSINAIQKFFYPFNIDKATKYVSLFTHMLRQTINFSDDTFILAKDEMIYIRDYLVMNSMRFGDRFKFEISGASQIPDLVRFPVMFLQPLIENATAHGISPKGESILQVHFAYDSQTVKCTILDNGLGIRSTMEQKKNYSTKRKSKGLLIISKKIRVLNQIYPNLNLTCTITDRQDDHPPARGTRVEVSFNSI